MSSASFSDATLQGARVLVDSALRDSCGGCPGPVTGWYLDSMYIDTHSGKFSFPFTCETIVLCSCGFGRAAA